MKKRIVFLTTLIFLVGIIFSGCGQSKNGSDSSWNDIKQKGEFVVGLDDSFPPMGFRDTKGNIVGFDIDMAKEAAKRMGVKVKFKPVDWDGVTLSLKNKDIDVIWNGLTITDKRKQQIAFSNVYLQNRQIIVARKDSNIKTKKDLSGKVVGLQLGSSSEIALNSDSSTKKSIKEVKKYSNNTEALLDLKEARIDAVVVDEVVGRYYASKKAGVYSILNDNFGKEDYGVGIRKNDISFKNKLNAALDSIKKDGTEKKISEKWFGQDVTSEK
ncbi:polar amino acid transport system substrate-binding protein [Clostridium algifaecis]|uniref:Polar amino acid transport system substrate-binding protein n=1 Tax=Clostridium algifaecis TaxID=1472040 RepID=A0ABS4KQ25_9CLOT|nr:amino acid ABC transporter substrate-binding protein [Clostridium algifaecis]MBP2032128.1 polar amino acid transport system substrate-binding protein [Clostridium algifaecis]